MEKFKSIPELIQSLNQLAMRIDKGSVGLEEFEATLKDARALYERLVILRYKAIEDRNLMGLGKAPPAAGKVNEPAESQIEKPLAPRQISLIDSIEEIAREQNDDGPDAPDEATAAARPDEATPKPQEPPMPPPVVSLPPEPKAKEVHSDVIPRSDEHAETLADKLSHTRIDDLTVAIGLNQKFQFINELFNGDAEAYKSTIDKLNKLENAGEARKLVQTELMQTYQWDEEDKVTSTFLGLVERRYL